MPLPTPQGRQKEVLYFPDAGHLVVLGAAGSGKTTLALHRAAWLATLSQHRGRTLLVTFNKTLVYYLRALGSSALANVDVENYHAFARGYLSSRGQLKPFGDIAFGAIRLIRVEAAINELKQTNPGSRILARPVELLDEEFAWISRMGITSLAQYRTAQRVQRQSFRILSQEKELVWATYERYVGLRKSAGFTYDWDDIASAVVAEFSVDKNPRRYQHVVIDEGQDLSPIALRSLVAAVPCDGTVTFFGDTAQQIYGSRITWRDAGLKVDASRIVHFEENYRNTQEIAAFAIALSEGKYFVGTPDMVKPKRPTAAGNLPTLVRFANEQREEAWVVDTAARLGKTRSVGVLLRDRTKVPYYISEIRRKGTRATILHRDMNGWSGGLGVWIGTHYAAKGIEFDGVIIPRLGDAELPDPHRVALCGDEDDACIDDVKLIYVAITRAKSELIMTHTSKPSRILDDIAPTLYLRATL
jgi:superfamily I DNA/RNA helicase